MAVESAKKAKRVKDPGVRVVGNRIYNSQNGKTCHQCRQKTMDFAASCKILKRDKQCTIKYCHKCLSNRYGEKAEEVVLLDAWTCPKCRGICNCSFCMKKRGQQPTGILTHTAKATGFSSVSELLQVRGPETLYHHKSINNIDASPENSASSKGESNGVSPRKLGKENSFDGTCDSNLKNETPLANEKKSKKTKWEGLKEVGNGNKCNNNSVEISPKRAKVERKTETAGFYKKLNADSIKSSNGLEDVNGVQAKVKTTKETRELKKSGSEIGDREIHVDIQLPQGTSSLTVAGVELPPEDVGYVLQFLEFCSAFGEALDLRKGQAESVIRELIRGRSSRRLQYSSVVQIHIQLLSVILKDRGEESPSLSPTGGKNCWLKAFGECIAESEYRLKGFSSEYFDKSVDAYEKMDTSLKLKLLNFLCDESLCTIALRDWIDNQNSLSVERKKEAKEKVAALREKEKHLKQKLQDKVARALIAKSGASLSISEHEAIVSQIKNEAAEAHTETMEAMGMLSKKMLRSDAVRTDPLLVDNNGHAFWRLRSYAGKPNILLQDLGPEVAASCNEKWFAFDTEQNQEVDRYISCMRLKRLRAQKRSDTLSNTISETK